MSDEFSSDFDIGGNYATYIRYLKIHYSRWRLPSPGSHPHPSNYCPYHFNLILCEGKHVFNEHGLKLM